MMTGLCAGSRWPRNSTSRRGKVGPQLEIGGSVHLRVGPGRLGGGGCAGAGADVAAVDEVGQQHLGEPDGQPQMTGDLHDRQRAAAAQLHDADGQGGHDDVYRFLLPLHGEPLVGLRDGAEERLRLVRDRPRSLLDRHVTITDLAHATGFSSASALSHASRRRFGVSPRELRQQGRRRAAR